jgi:hypothetical protein
MWPEACALIESPRTRGQPETTPREAPRYPDGDALVHKPGAGVSALAALVVSQLPYGDVSWSESVIVKANLDPNGVHTANAEASVPWRWRGDKHRETDRPKVPLLLRTSTKC